MYHPGKIVEIFSPSNKNINAADRGTQAFLEMWDENHLTLNVDAKIEKKIKKNDIVLVDYSVTKIGPKMTVIKILKNDTGKRTWTKYKDYFEKRKKQPRAMQPVLKPINQPYVG